MVCEKCRYVNKDTAEVCKHCGAPFKETPQTVYAAPRHEPKAANAGNIITPSSLTTSRGPRIKTAAQAITLKDYGYETPKSVKTVSFSKPQPAVVTREYNIDAGENEESEADAAEQDKRRDNIKFIAIVTTLVVFIIGALIVFMLLLFGKQGAPASAASALPSAASALPSATSAAAAEPSSDLPSTAESDTSSPLATP